MNIETVNLTVSLEPLDVSKIKIDGRPPISNQKTTKGRVTDEHAQYPQMASQSNADLTKIGQAIASKPLDSVENISTRMDKAVDEPKLVKEESSESRRLKDLLLLHLDLIQQQQDLHSLKDRQISQLKQDNYTLRCRLERMERRVSMMKGGSPVKPESLSPSADRDSSHRLLKRKTSLEPQSLARRFAKLARTEFEKDRSQGRIRSHHSAPGGRLEKHRTHRRKGLSRLSLAHKVQRATDRLHRGHKAGQSPPTPRQTTTSHMTTDPESHWISRSLRNRHLTASGETVPTPTKRQLIVRDETEATPTGHSKNHSSTPGKRTDSKHKGCRGETERAGHSVSRRGVLPRDSDIMKTGLMYYVPDLDKPEKEVEVVSRPTEAQVDVPSFRIKKFMPYYVIEGTENYDDEVFAKRHQKHELEEKKRKRWDLQRQREQEQLQKLQEKQHPRGGGVGAQDGGLPDSLVPDTDRIEMIEVCEELPVSVFGVPLPKLDHRDFSVPWFDLERRERQEARKCKSRRR